MNDISEKEKEEETKELLKIELGLSQLIKVNVSLIE